MFKVFGEFGDTIYFYLDGLWFGGLKEGEGGRGKVGR